MTELPTIEVVETSLKFKELLAHLKERFQCDWGGEHGIRHWGRVLRNGLLLASKEPDVRKDIVQLFALLHDSCRWNDGADPDHGPRAAEWLPELRGKYFEMPNDAFSTLQYAIRMHSTGLTLSGAHENWMSQTIKVCWDADRLDLGRFHQRPIPLYLCTATGKDPAFIEAAFQRSLARPSRNYSAFAKGLNRDWDLHALRTDISEKMIGE